MSARTTAPAGWVTVAAAAAALTRAGDKIDASNVSRYLARNPEISSEKIGRCRFVDLGALMAHRNTSVFVGDKRQARDLVDAMAETRPAKRPAPALNIEDEDERPAPAGSELSAANLELKRLQVREKQLEMRVREGGLIEAVEVTAVVSGVIRALVSELERQEGGLTARHGREVGADVRKSRKAAQTAAAVKLTELARKHLPADLASRLGAPSDDQAAA